jgi:hypothetical protein
MRRNPWGCQRQRQRLSGDQAVGTFVATGITSSRRIDHHRALIPMYYSRYDIHMYYTYGRKHKQQLHGFIHVLYSSYY